MACTLQNGFGISVKEAQGVKVEMQELNSKLAQYMHKVCELKKAAAVGGDASSYYQAMRQLESEIMKIRALYESEIEKLRAKLEAAFRDKNQMISHTQTYIDLQGRFTAEVNRAKRLEEEIRALEKALADKERENSDLICRLNRLEKDFVNLQKSSGQASELQLKLTIEAKEKRDLEEKLKQLADKHKFEIHMNAANEREMQERIKTANDIIQALEAKMKQLNGMGADLPSVLQKMREGTVAEMKRFQKETEYGLGKNIEALKKQLDDDANHRNNLSLENRQLEISIRKLKATIGDLEGKMKALQIENGALCSEIENERAKGQVVIKDLEKKLRDLQERLMCSTKEFASTRDAQLSIKAEIETYRRLLEGELCRCPSRGATPKLPRSPGIGKSTNFVTNGNNSYSTSKTFGNGGCQTSGNTKIGIEVTSRPLSSRGQYTPRGYQTTFNTFRTTYNNDFNAPRLSRTKTMGWY